MKSKFNWAQLVTYILEELFFSQRELAEHCNVTQQSVSNWKMNVRLPGAFAKRKLSEIANKAGVRIYSFANENDRDEDSPDVTLHELTDIYNELPLLTRNTVLEFARFLSQK